MTEIGELVELLALDPGVAAGAAGADRDFPLRVPRAFVARMARGDPADPLLHQVLPRRDELEAVPGYTRDPLAEASASPVPGILHKYRGRVVVLCGWACAVHCRYCFRRHLPAAMSALRPERLATARDYLATDESIGEVILSGGDPLSLPDALLGRLVTELAAIPHLRRLRVHSRMPIVLPARVDGELLRWLAGTRLKAVVVVHVNHPREIDREVTTALGRLRTAGCTLLNQSVLLRGVNDRAETLRELSETLFAAGVLPYYLHLLDRVRGAAHFAVADPVAERLLRELTATLPGYLVPRLVREVPGAPAKVPLCFCGQGPAAAAGELLSDPGPGILPAADTPGRDRR